ncbi:fungal-specific transcription factor domain-domain-containing protein [Aspergillus taichungensis]|uniref:Fungal-specific transcription factor domain-domain-containing protein n=1 Tax=Aspergillus taichungensis TaxID=482145 RepID=A0A2J5HSN5_9EURO|nr:fungal-specific transcription factor domain-domain-containing protein [Aspergillus taichungensis]
MLPHSDTTGSASRSRKRAAAACHACHARKVRCSISRTGPPCTNCSLDNSWVDPRRAGLSVDILRRPRGTTRTRRRGNNPPRPSSHAGSIIQDGANLGEPVYRPMTGHFGHHSELQDGRSTSPQSMLQTACSPVYGDPQGIALVAEVCEPERQGKSGHFIVASLSSGSIDPDTLEYLKRKGCFDLPAFEIQQELVKTYFHYVHPFFPVVQISSFLQAFESQEQKGASLHLLWSVFLAAANFADTTTVQSAGFESRKTMKRSMFLRAKALYDAEYERSKITLIQAVLLMGFWYADTEDRIGPWHWNGVAISLCQSIGLHRQPDASFNGVQYGSSVNRDLWMNLWWSCFFREAWLSVGMGRPMRIDLEHSDTQRPDASASERLCSGLTEAQRKEYLPDNPHDLFLLWDQLLCVTSILSRILAVQHLAKRTLLSQSDVIDLDRELRGHHGHLDYLRASVTEPVLTLHMHHFELFFESTLLTLYRPFILQSLGHQAATTNDKATRDWLSSAERKATTAAMNTTNILSNMITADMIRLSQSLICIVLVPTLQIHLLHSVSPRKLVQRLGSHQLDLCMMVVNELKVTYFGAEILSRLFTRARETINSRRRGPEFTSVGPDTGNASNAEGRQCRGDETPVPASPVVWESNVPGDDWRETDSRYVKYLGHECLARHS